MSSRLLLVEDNPGDVLLLQSMLEESYPGQYAIDVAGTLGDAKSLLGTQAFDAVLLDLSLPDSRGLETLGLFNATASGVPILVLTGLDDEDAALEAVRRGAQDYLLKGRTDARTIARAIRYAVERKRAEEQLKALNETLEQRVAQRTAEAEHRAKQLRAMVVELTRTEQRARRRLAQALHDHLQQILVAAHLKLERLRRRAEHDPALMQLADEVHGLIDESINESRSLTMEISPPVLYDVGLAAGLLWLARWIEQKHGLAVEVVADPAAEPQDQNLRIFLFEAVRELLINVVKHAEAQRAEVDMSRTAEGETRVEVRDTGVGYEPQRSVRTTTNGSGFGLFSLRERLELLGGRMEVEAAPGQGTRVAILVAAGEPPALDGPVAVQRGAAPLPQVASPSRGGLRVLLADDHPVVRKGVADMLREQPEIEAVFEARDGLEAVDLALQTRPNVVVLDISMPRLSGVEAARQIRAQLPEARIIGLSMHEEADMAEAMYEAGAAVYLRKDVASEALVAAILD